MLWVKAFHIVFVASWFAGLFYLPRLFVNLAMVEPGSEAERARLLGYASHAEYITSDQTAGSPADVEERLRRLAGPAARNALGRALLCQLEALLDEVRRLIIGSPTWDDVKAASAEAARVAEIERLNAEVKQSYDAGYMAGHQEAL
jgi:hypothetical protein